MNENRWYLLRDVHLFLLAGCLGVRLMPFTARRFFGVMGDVFFRRVKKGISCMNKLVFALAFVVMAFGLSACNTVKGVGQDISSGASTVQGWF
jgi:predicted small secreted protein